jgi:Ca2+-binding EF-hand superfamily protein
MKFNLTQFLGKSVADLATNPVYAPISSIFPDFSVRALSALDEGLFGETMVFKLNQNARGRKKNRRKKSSTDDSKSLHFEAQIDNINGKPHLDVENEDMQDLVDALDTNNNGKISKGELKRSTVTALTNIDLIENHSRDTDVTTYMKSENVFFQYTPEPIIFGKPGPGTLEFNTDPKKLKKLILILLKAPLNQKLKLAK